MRENKFMGTAIEPCRDAGEFVDQLAFKRRHWFEKFELCPAKRWVGRRPVPRAPRVEEASAVEFGAAAVGQLKSDSPGASKSFEPSLTTQCRGEGFGSIAHVSSLFESFLTGECGESFTERGEEQFGFEGETTNSALNNAGVLGRVDTAGTRAERNTELRSGARRLAPGSGRNATGAATKWNRGVDGVDNPLRSAA